MAAAAAASAAVFESPALADYHHPLSRPALIGRVLAFHGDWRLPRALELMLAVSPSWMDTLRHHTPRLMQRAVDSTAPGNKGAGVLLATKFLIACRRRIKWAIRFLLDVMLYGDTPEAKIARQESYHRALATAALRYSPNLTIEILTAAPDSLGLGSELLGEIVSLREVVLLSKVSPLERLIAITTFMSVMHGQEATTTALKAAVADRHRAMLSNTSRRDYVLELLKYFIQERIITDQIQESGGYMLTRALASTQEDETIRLLLAHGADPNQCETFTSSTARDMKTPLSLACESRREPIVRLLLAMGAFRNYNAFTSEATKEYLADVCVIPDDDDDDDDGSDDDDQNDAE